MMQLLGKMKNSHCNLMEDQRKWKNLSQVVVEGKLLLMHSIWMRICYFRSSGELLQEYKGHTCKSFKMDSCLTNDDAFVVGGSEDGYIFFWELVDAPVVARFRAHSSVVTSISYHPTKACMLTSSVDGSIRVWT
ncbi:Transducin/WD40 repeat-like superfamily protein [Zea mays]|uniref:Transducin/WD40 repeat-like superfamily protein n=1 Tax=Zea mays TaxID=4577 RepID=A0A1D6Q2Y7_MAIZE|nr:Transducin/WD40 repeat-like superfamily protein [Zea mays]